MDFYDFWVGVNFFNGHIDIILDCFISDYVLSLCLLLSADYSFAQLQELTETEIQILRDNGLTVPDTDQDTWILEHHGIPDHGFPGGWGGKKTATVQNYSVAIPKIASVQETKGCVRLGPIAMSISSVPFFNPYTVNGQNAVEGECEKDFDDCSGHPERTGQYHYHKLPACIYKHTPNQFLGVAFDGFPIYGPMDESSNNLTSLDLDECHGHWHNGRYKYRATLDFPYIIGCYNGALTQFQNFPPPLPNGGRPLPSGTRMKREYDLNVGNKVNDRVKRQDIDCSELYSDWIMKTCYASFCRRYDQDYFRWKACDRKNNSKADCSACYGWNNIRFWHFHH